MNIDKAELKIAITNDIGATIEDSYEAAKKEMYRQEGAVNAYKHAAKACETLAEHVKRDIDEGRVDLATGEHINRYVSRAAALQHNLQRQAENVCIAAAGKIAGIESVLETLKKYRHAEQLKVNAARVEVPAGPVPEMRPGLTIKERRRLEEQQAETVLEALPAKETEPVVVETVLEALVAEETVSVSASVNGASLMPKRRGRPPKKRD